MVTDHVTILSRSSTQITRLIRLGRPVRKLLSPQLAPLSEGRGGLLPAPISDFYFLKAQFINPITVVLDFITALQ